jgi:hypothetical protein
MGSLSIDELNQSTNDEREIIQIAIDFNHYIQNTGKKEYKFEFNTYDQIY